MDLYADRRILDPLPLDRASRTMGMRMTVGRAGSKPSPGPTSHIYGMRDCHGEDAFLYIPPASLPCSIKLRLRLASSEAISKRMDIVIQRELHSRSEEHTSELPSLMRIYYSVLCFK